MDGSRRRQAGKSVESKGILTGKWSEMAVCDRYGMKKELITSWLIWLNYNREWAFVFLNVRLFVRLKKKFLFSVSQIAQIKEKKIDCE